MTRASILEYERRLAEVLAAPPKRRAPSTERLRVKAAVVTADVDLGDFVAVISTESIDREKDVVSAAGMVAALRAWTKPIPLMWAHGKNAEDVIGSVDPKSVHAQHGEVVASGKVDLNSATGREAWRAFKSRVIGFSFGYMTIASTKRADGGRNIVELDVYEVSATPTPMNNQTRVLASKGVNRDVPTLDELERRAHALGLPTPKTMQVRREMRDAMLAALKHR